MAVVGLKAHILSKTRPESGTLIYISPQGRVDAVAAGINLDSTNLNAQAMNGLRLTSDEYFAHNYITLAKDEPVAFHVLIFAAQASYDFTVDIILSDNSVISMDNKGKALAPIEFLADLYPFLLRRDYS